MGAFLEADEFEPNNLVRLMLQSIPVVVASLNRSHRSDYFFGNYIGETFQFSRKQAGELIGNVDEAEDQLADYYHNADHNYQIVEGWISPLPIQGIQIVDHTPTRKATIRDLGQKLYCYAIQPYGKIERGHSFSAVNTSMLYAWIHRLDRAGIATYWTTNWTETAKLLVAIFRNEQKPPEEHQTLNRIIKPRTIVRNEDTMSEEERKSFHLTKALMFLSDAYKLGIGEKRARALATQYVNLMDLAMADIADIARCEGLGTGIARKLLTALGRTL